MSLPWVITVCALIHSLYALGGPKKKSPPLVTISKGKITISNVKVMEQRMRRKGVKRDNHYWDYENIKTPKELVFAEKDAEHYLEKLDYSEERVTIDYKNAKDVYFPELFRDKAYYFESYVEKCPDEKRKNKPCAKIYEDNDNKRTVYIDAEQIVKLIQDAHPPKFGYFYEDPKKSGSGWKPSYAIVPLDWKPPKQVKVYGEGTTDKDLPKTPLGYNEEEALRSPDNLFFDDMDEDEMSRKSLNIPFIDLFIMGEGVIFMVMIGSIFCCLCLAIGGLIGHLIRIYTDKEGTEDKVYDTDIV